ncbi:hypothetical protein QQF64_036400 [Cirrhinus molitorella]|uniref:Uncharacterized protein n=1 Tax=Cirrhinus molitorella TaxID=172907 RepID=A0ABR3NJ43_9TELE
MAVLQAYQADLLKDLDKGQGLSPDDMAELRRTTDLALRATKQAATAMGRSMAVPPHTPPPVHGVTEAPISGRIWQISGRREGLSPRCADFTSGAFRWDPLFVSGPRLLLDDYRSWIRSPVSATRSSGTTGVFPDIGLSVHYCSPRACWSPCTGRGAGPLCVRVFEGAAPSEDQELLLVSKRSLRNISLGFSTIVTPEG